MFIERGNCYKTTRLYRILEFIKLILIILFIILYAFMRHRYCYNLHRYKLIGSIRNLGNFQADHATFKRVIFYVIFIKYIKGNFQDLLNY